MAAKISPNELLVFDTSFAIALCVPSDENHQRAIALGKQIVERKARLLTTRAIFFEIGNSLAKQRYRKTAIDLMGELESDSNVEILPLTEDLYEEAYSLFVARDDKEWGLVDCLSFEVMWDRNVTQALTTDEHFEQAGFVALLRE